MEDNVLIRRVAVESVSEKYQVDSGYDVIGKECLKNNNRERFKFCVNRKN